ncbi:hypothetical protein OSB04_un000702 [Centaurea solstitialis]|uniref:TIR domain-containing protein n=1 Tax=Centaurea solstitialis TaxID=347529 RepID=A0AA38SH73_9ASTR|nr:hypothetical protein OSB04_un000702 [Centaurea solstitialis]
MNQEQESQSQSSSSPSSCSSNNLSTKISAIDLDPTINLTIKIPNFPHNNSTSQNFFSNFTPATSSSSPPFFSALQSPYTSPRATGDNNLSHPSTTAAAATTATAATTPTTFTQPSTPASYSDDIPTTSYTPTSERFDFSDAGAGKIKISDQTSFSFPASTAKLRSCDVYIGYHGQDPNLTRFCKWVKSDLELQGIACFLADRAKYADSQSHEIADRLICSATFGVIIVTKCSLLSYLTSEEIRFFAQKKNLIPILFNTNLDEIKNLDCKEAIDGLMKFNEFKLEANEGNWRKCVSRSISVLKGKLGRKSYGDQETETGDVFPFRKNGFFVGREKEIAEIERVFFDFGGKVKNKSLVCINGGSGMGKTEVALEFAHRYEQRYKMVIWVGGEARYLRQNLLNLSLDLGLDLSADLEKERGRIRSFDEQETEAFRRVKRELFRDKPYLLIIDNLETENGWWEGRDLRDLIPRNTGSSHVIITTRLPKVMNCEPMKLEPLPSSDAMALMRGRRTEEYPSHEVEILEKFDRKLGRSSFGLRVVGCLLTELTISPSVLFQSINSVPLEETSSHLDDPFWDDNRFLLKVLIFCIMILNEVNGTKNRIAFKMLLAGSWLAPSPISASLLAAAASHLNPSKNGFKKWNECVNPSFFCCSSLVNKQKWRSEQDSAFVLVKLGLAKRSNGSPGCWILIHPITRIFAKRKGGLVAAKASIEAVRKIGNPTVNSDHLWACAFLVFGFKSTPPFVQLKPLEMVHFIKRTALPLAIQAFTMFSRCNSALELLKVCTNVLEEVEKSFVSRIQDWCHGSLYWKKKKKKERVDEYVWQDVTLLKATLLETRARLLMRGGHFDYGEELCRTCISIRTVMLGHNHAQTLAAQETLSRLVRMRSKI